MRLDYNLSDYKERFNHNAESYEEAVAYLKARTKQLLRFGVSLISIQPIEHGNALGIFNLNGIPHVSVYILEGNRGKGQYVESLNLAKDKLNLPKSIKVLTAPNCEIQTYLERKDIPYTALHPNMLDSYFNEYDIISSYWEFKYARRTGVHYMNHVDEGLRVILESGGGDRAMRIFALHGVLQQCYSSGSFQFDHWYEDIRPNVLIGAMEYRSVANAHLAHHPPETLRLSEDHDVNIALIADKVQNRKDFERFHKGRHPKSDELDAYFKRWLRKLGVSEERYQELCEIISNGD